MTKETAKKVEAAKETKVEAAREMMTNANEKIAQTTKAMNGLFSALTASSRLAFQGAVAVDKAVLGYATEAVKSYADLGRQSVSAKTVNDLVDLHVAHAHNRIEKNAANTREVLDMAQSKAKEAYAPVKVALSAYKVGNKAA